MSAYNHLGVSRRAGDAPVELATLAPGFSDPVHDAQRVFRMLLDALSRPGKIASVASALPGFDASTAFAGAPVPLAAYAALLTLADYVTPVWQPEQRVLGDALRFHTGAPLAADCADAAFAYVADPDAMPPLHAFSIGHAQSPQDAATLLIRVDSLSDGPPLQWSGPGIAGACTVRVGGLPPRFWRERAALATQFPCGIDCFLVSGASLVGLPRTTHVEVD
jgi:alpha-D-ribose 1-methylphosphonate 5-triphosphate synthase subunit PhnH